MTDLCRSHLAIEHALLFEPQILGGVGHYGEGGFGVMPERKEENHKIRIMITFLASKLLLFLILERKTSLEE